MSCALNEFIFQRATTYILNLQGTVRPLLFREAPQAAARLCHPSGTLSQASHVLCVAAAQKLILLLPQALAPHTHCFASERSFRAQALLALCGVLLSGD